MPVYIFTKLKDQSNDFDKTKVIIECETEDKQDLLECFKEFLVACGYTVKGEIVENNDE